MNKKILACVTLFCFTFSNLGGTQKNTHALNVTNAISAMSQASDGDSIFSRAASYVKEKLSALTSLFEVPKRDLKGVDTCSGGHAKRSIAKRADSDMGCIPDPYFSGDCNGANAQSCTWSLRACTGEITLNNAVENSAMGIDWYCQEGYMDDVSSGVISDGMTYISWPFSNLPNLKKVTLPDSLRTIIGVVNNCDQIEEITIPDGVSQVTTIAEGCDNLKFINIGKGRFSSTDRSLTKSCPNLISVNVADDNPTYKSVNGALLSKDGEILYEYPFGRSSRVVIPYGVKKSLYLTLMDVPSESVVIPETAEELRDAFSNGDNLTKITFLGKQAPSGNSDLKASLPQFKNGTAVINVPQSYNDTEFWGYPVNKIFDDYGYLADTTTYWTTKHNGTHLSIGGEGELTSDLLSDENQGWFAHNATLEQIDIEEGITAVDMNMFVGCNKLKKIALPSTLQKLVIADGTIDGAVTVDTSLFANCSNLAEIVLPESAKSLIFAPGTTAIDFSMFSNLESVEEVTIPSGVDSVDIGTLAGKSQNAVINYLGVNHPTNWTYCPANITANVRKDYVGFQGSEDYIFGFPVNRVFDCGTCNDIKWLNGPHNTLEITGSGAIDANCPWKDLKNSVKKLVIGDGITSIAPGTFYGYNFMDIKLPDTLETIGWSAFDSCRQLTNVVLPSGVKSIGKKAFKGCENLESITLNEGLEEIGENAFDGCKNLHSITLPKSVKKIEEKALWNSALTEIHVADGNDFYYDVDGVLLSKPDLALVQYPTGKGGHYTVPENVTNINNSAFARAENLESVTIQGPLDLLDEDAFYGCRNLKSVHIDGEVERIGNHAFAYCENLRILEYNGEPKLGENVFIGCGVMNKTNTWTLSNVLDDRVAAAIYANGVWVARPYLGQVGDLYHSKNGKSWSTVSVAAKRLNFVTHENGLWVAGGLDGMYYSTDGEAWTKTNISGSCSFATNANGLWVAGGYGSDEYEGLYYSVDGKSWTSARFPGSSCNTAKYANGVWVLSGLSSDTGLYYSTDGMNWTQSNVTAGGFQTITYTDGLWHAGGYNSGTGLYYSTDGKTWTLSNLPSGESSFNDYGTYSVITKANDVWVTGEFGQNNYCTGLYYSTDGKTWTQSNVVSGSFEFIVNANGLWVAGSNGHSTYSNRGLYYSTDGKTWTQSNITSGSVKFVENANGMWVAGILDDDDNYKNCGLYYSIDGKTWIKSNVSSQGLTFATNANGMWVASGFDGLYYSTVLWTFT